MNRDRRRYVYRVSLVGFSGCVSQIVILGVFLEFEASLETLVAKGVRLGLESEKYFIEFFF